VEDNENGIIGKKILVIFEDAKDHYAKKVGICTSNSEIEISLNNKDFIPRNRIIRIEVLENIREVEK